MRGRPPTRKKGAYTDAERMRRYRRRLKRSRPDPKTLAKQQRRNAREAELGAKLWALPTRHAGILYVDPPLVWQPRSRVTGMDRSAENHYARMPFEEYRKIALPMAEDCIVFHWAWRDERLEMIQQYLREQCLQRRTLIAWKKAIPGTGLILRDNCELLLIAARGKPVWPTFGQQSLAAIEAVEPWEGLFDGIIEAPNPQHSRKPEIFADEISRLWPNTPKLEMFYRALDDPEAERVRRAKREAAGWYFWGNEVEAAAE